MSSRDFDSALRLVLKLARDYNAQLKAGKLPTFDAAQYPEVQDKLVPGVWDQR